eukprot:965861-Rhodomonas_salina.2
MPVPVTCPWDLGKRRNGGGYGTEVPGTLETILGINNNSQTCGKTLLLPYEQRLSPMEQKSSPHAADLSG